MTAKYAFVTGEGVADCNNEQETGVIQISVTEDGDNYRFTFSNGKEFSAPVEGSTVSLPLEVIPDQSYFYNGADHDGTETETFKQLTILSDSLFTGVKQWSFTDGTESCTGEERWTAVKTSGSTSTSETASVGIENPVGSAQTTTPLGTTETTDAVPEGSTVQTGADASLDLVRDDSRVTLDPGTTLTILPIRSEDGVQVESYLLVAGKIYVDVQHSAGRRVEIITPAGTVTVTGTTFSVEYSRTGLLGTVDVAVTSGAVQIVSTDGVSSTVSAGDRYTVNQNLDRSSWIQPAYGAYIYGGVVNTISWTGFEGAAGYLLEYTFPVPSFGAENTSSPEFQEKTFYFTASNYSVTDGVVELPMTLPDLTGPTVEARIYPVDANGVVLDSGVSSNKVKVKFK